MTNAITPEQLERMRARHEAAQADGRYDLSWHEDHGLLAHADRAVLLARVAELEGALKPLEKLNESFGHEYDKCPNEQYAIGIGGLGIKSGLTFGDLRRAARVLRDHSSDCATHNMPAKPAEECDCKE